LTNVTQRSQRDEAWRNGDIVRYRIPAVTVFVLLLILAMVAERERVEAVEISRENKDLLPKGKEAEGIPGDFVLRNNKVHALISGTQPLRRANMRTENNFVTQGCLYDLDLRGEDNDQITAFRPGDAGGEVSWVRIVDAPGRGGAIESVRTAAKGDGLYVRHEYRLEPDWEHILVTSTYRNESQNAKKIKPRPVWRGFEDSKEWNVAGVQIADSTDPFDKRAYAWGVAPGGAPLEAEVELQRGQEKVYKVALAVADSPLAAYGLLAALTGKAGEVTGTVIDSSGTPAARASLLVLLEITP
jgi:hypothetical protein